MRRGISGGQKKRLTTGEMIVGPSNALFMDEISNGLDSSTTHQIVACLQQLSHATNTTILVSLLQPAPEIFDLFDDIILMAEGRIVYQGPRENIIEFFEGCGFRCPKPKEIADFLQEVMSRKDQVQYCYQDEQNHIYVSPSTLSQRFKQSVFGNKLNEELKEPFKNSESNKSAASYGRYSLSKWSLFKACMSREFLLMRRNYFIYIFKSMQLMLVACVTMTIFLRSQMDIDIIHANFYLSMIFFSLVIFLINGFPEMHMCIARLAIFYKQRDLYFYPAWAYAVPSLFLQIPLSLVEALVWTLPTYYVVGFTPEVGRFFRQLILNFAFNLTSTSIFRFLASVFQTLDASIVSANLVLVSSFLFGGFVIPKPSIPTWLKWGFWTTPMAYGQIGLSVNEFLAPRWQVMQMQPFNMTTGKATLISHGLSFTEYYFWISIGALFGFAVVFNIGFTLALGLLKPPASRHIISREKLVLIQECEKKIYNCSETITRQRKDKMVLPFEPLSLVFQDLQYYVDTPLEMKRIDFTQKKLRLLCDITGAFRPGVLTALMGVSGAGKTTLLDVLAGRKTNGIIEGQIKIGGYPKVQETFARVSGYCEQTDIHSPQMTVEESLIFSAWLRLQPKIDSETKFEFVKEVLETIELMEVKDNIVGMPGLSGLSNEQRKRLTIAVELVSNPSIIFMDEPTTGLDARAAAIVMRSVENVANTGRTIVCTIHQPNVDIFEAFEELILLRSGGHLIYAGPLGKRSRDLIEYFEGIPGVPKINTNRNPATWLLEITSASSENILGIDFAQVYKESTLYEKNKELVKRLSIPPAGSQEIHFPTRFSKGCWGQFKCCLWKQHLSYWRSPSYNLRRIMFILITSLLYGIVFWNQGQKIKREQNLLDVLAVTYLIILFSGSSNSTSVLPYISTERMVSYREKFSGMYAPWIYASAQVVIEVPYLFTQALASTIITYPMIGYYWSAYKILWYFYALFCNLLSFTYSGMLFVSMTPNFEIAATIHSTVYILSNLFVGFLIPRPKLPKWWEWFYFMFPSSWVLNGLLTSQYGDMEEEIMVFGESKTIAAFMTDYFGFHYDQLNIVALVIISFPILFASLFALCIEKLNFQKR